MENGVHEIEQSQKTCQKWTIVLHDTFLSLESVDSDIAWVCKISGFRRPGALEWSSRIGRKGGAGLTMEAMIGLTIPPGSQVLNKANRSNAQVRHSFGACNIMQKKHMPPRRLRWCQLYDKGERVYKVKTWGEAISKAACELLWFQHRSHTGGVTFDWTNGQDLFDRLSFFFMA